MWHDFLAIQLILLQEYIDYAVRPSPYPSSLEKNIQFDSTNWSFCLFQTRFLQATQAVKIQIDIDKKSSSLNLIFQTRDFKNQVEMDKQGEKTPVKRPQNRNVTFLFHHNFVVLFLFSIDLKSCHASLVYYFRFPTIFCLYLLTQFILEGCF